MLLLYGYTPLAYKRCEWRGPHTVKSIQALLKQLTDTPFWDAKIVAPNTAGVEQLSEKFPLPADYKALMMCTDGITLFQSGDHNIIRSVADVIAFTEISEFQHQVYEVGYLLDTTLVIHGAEILSTISTLLPLHALMSLFALAPLQCF